MWRPFFCLFLFALFRIQKINRKRLISFFEQVPFKFWFSQGSIRIRVTAKFISLKIDYQSTIQIFLKKFALIFDNLILCFFCFRFRNSYSCFELNPKWLIVKPSVNPNSAISNWDITTLTFFKLYSFLYSIWYDSHSSSQIVLSRIQILKLKWFKIHFRLLTLKSK